MDFLEVADALNKIRLTSSTLEKKSLLEFYGKHVEGFKDVLRFVYDPYFTTGLKQRKLDTAYIDQRGVGATAEEIMDYLKKHNTGSTEAAEVANGFIYAADDPVWQWAAQGLVTKDLQIGVSVTTLNNVYGKGFLPKIGIMRGMHCPPDAAGYYICTEKIDGNRRLIFVHEDGTTEAFTRSGHRDDGLVEILEEAKRLPHGYVYDCECVAIGEFKDSIALRQASASILNRGSATEKTGVKALCFDMLPVSEYNMGGSKLNGAARKYILAHVMGDEASCYKMRQMFPSWATAFEALVKQRNLPSITDLKLIAALPILGLAHNKEEAVALAQPIWDSGGEGVMMLAEHAAYEVNPNPRKTLLKIKGVYEYTLRCVGMREGEGKYIGMLGAITVEYKHKGGVSDVDVGSGFADYQREEFWQHPDLILNHMVEIESFGESVNKDGGTSLNCPIFKRIAGDED